MMTLARGKDLCILRLYLNDDIYLLKLSEVCQKVEKETYAHQPFTESTRQMGIVSLLWLKKKCNHNKLEQEI